MTSKLLGWLLGAVLVWLITRIEGYPRRGQVCQAQHLPRLVRGLMLLVAGGYTWHVLNLVLFPPPGFERNNIRILAASVCVVWTGVAWFLLYRVRIDEQGITVAAFRSRCVPYQTITKVRVLRDTALSYQIYSSLGHSVKVSTLITNLRLAVPHLLPYLPPAEQARLVAHYQT
ncbi:hypothetical protein EII12_04445 [Buchananella hordeovulneris]|uniref:Uncharacterized protein n=1 Tax=Buchananella hordeovulneris TaxID=52770 RepID=A0A1Q5PWP4_9ACTO|nr:hypothetical protein [Buchananella hordeovulneris]OKL52018.1 hypothetical protein BSZ40_03560 [Buchananella hordeovulneris]RRD52585.1 hypothetical protein EII12_04445 [Buchananella hordeovulneris]